MAIQLPNGRNYFATATGAPAIGYKVYTYVAGTSTPKDTYTTSAASVANTNPVVLNARGEAAIYWNGTYDVTLKDASDVTVWGPERLYAPDLADWLTEADLASTASVGLGDALVGVKRTATGAIATTEHAWHESQAFDAVADFGMSTSANAATNTASLTAAIGAATTAGVGVVEIQAGTYAITAGTNFAAANVAIVGKGRVVLDYSAGTGVGFKLDAGGSGSIIRGMRIENITFLGGASITDIFYSRGMVAGTFRNLKAKEATNTGFKILFGVLNTYQDCRVSNDDAAMTTSPTRYWYLDNDGTVGNHTQANTFINCDASGKGATSTSWGWTLVDATLNTWIGGTAESMNIGLEIQDDQCRNNAWYGFDFEDNQTNDATIKGFANAFYTSSANSASSGNTISISTGINTLFVGGYMRLVNLGGSSSNTSFLGTHFEDNVALGIQGTGSYKAYGITEGNGYATSVAQNDVLGATTTGIAFVCTQGATPTKTLTLNEARVTGQMVYAQANFAFTSAGTGGNAILVDFPAAYTAKANAVGMPVGTFVFNKGGTRTSGVVILQAATEFAFMVNQGTNLFGINPATTIANTDTLAFSAAYPLA